MHLTMGTDYALRTPMYLGLKDGGLAAIEEVADADGVSRAHLM